MGDLYVRGPWVIDGYLHGQGAEAFTDDGWFKTGDVAIASPDGYFVIADRTKDLIKSGGEWISSVDMEAAVMEMAAVVEAAVIAVPDPKWQERPLVCVVLEAGRVESRSTRCATTCSVGRLRPLAAARSHRGDRRRAPDQRRQVRQEGPAGPLRLTTERRPSGPDDRVPVQRLLDQGLLDIVCIRQQSQETPKRRPS